MEEGQRHCGSKKGYISKKGLNPCCNGRGSKTIFKEQLKAKVLWS